MPEPFLKVYSTLTLGAPEVLEAMGALASRTEVAPPIQAGDLLKDIRRGMHVVVIIDGKFFQSYAVAPSEIVDGLRAGLKIYGASSMGALRASETEAHGMIGCGEVFQYIRATPYFRDDLLGQSFDADSGQAFSTSWVDTYFNLRKLCARGELSEADAALLAEAGAAVHFSERTAASYKAEMRRAHPGREDLDQAIDKAFDPALGSQKQRDGIEVLTRVREDLERTQDLNQKIAARCGDSRFDLGLFHR